MGEIVRGRSQGVIAPHVLMLFLDGVGIGRKDTQTNPFLDRKSVV